MARPNRAAAPKGTRGSRRKARESWRRPFASAARTFSNCGRMILRAVVGVRDSRACARQQPVRALRKLMEARQVLAEMARGLARAKRNLARTDACVARGEPGTEDLPELLLEWVDSYAFLIQWASEIREEISAIEAEVMDGLMDGSIVIEPPARPRIALTPRPAPVRAFLRVRPIRAADRVAVILLRRRRTLRPAALSAPPETDQGRAPPLSSVCQL